MPPRSPTALDPRMDNGPLGGQPSAIHFYLLGCFLEQRRTAFLVHMEANAQITPEPMAMVDLFLKDLDIAFEVQGYQHCLEPQMTFIPSLRRISKVISELEVGEGATQAALWNGVWRLLANGSFLPLAYAEDAVKFVASKSGPPFRIRPWWLSPLTTPTRSGVLQEFQLALDSLPMSMPINLEQAATNKFGEELRTAFKDIQEQHSRTRQLSELYDDLATRAAARVAKFTQIYPDQ